MKIQLALLTGALIIVCWLAPYIYAVHHLIAWR